MHFNALRAGNTDKPECIQTLGMLKVQSDWNANSAQHAIQTNLNAFECYTCWKFRQTGMHFIAQHAVVIDKSKCILMLSMLEVQTNQNAFLC